MFHFHRSSTRSEKGRLSVFAAGFALTLALVAVQTVAPRTLGFLEREVYDQFMRTTRRAPLHPESLPVVVDLDEKSLRAFGQWPWPRYRVALLLGLLRKEGAKSVAIDVLFSERDRTSPDMVKRQFREDLNIDVEYQGLPPQFKDFDDLLAKMLKTGPFVPSFFMELSPPAQEPDREAPPCLIQPLNVTLVSDRAGGETLKGATRAYGIKCPLPALAEAAPKGGFFNALPDRDNVIRRGPAVIEYNGALYPSLGFAAALKAHGVTEVVGKVSEGQLVTLTADFPGLGRRSIPLDEEGRMLFNFRGPGGAFPRISAADVMTGKMPPGFVKDRIVFLGTSAVGLLDIQATPLDQATPGVEVQATVADMIQTGDFIERPSFAKVLETSCTLLAGVLSTILLAMATSRQLMLPFCAFGGILWFGASLSFSRLGLSLSPVFPLVTLITNFALLTFMKFWREERMKRFIHRAFSRFISPKVVEQIVKSPERLKLTGEEREMTILVTDIRGFSTFSEKLTPNQTAELLQTFFTPITGAISHQMGTIDKFFGDAVMAFWNAPLDLPGHGRLAMECALKLSEAADVMGPMMLERFGVNVDIGVGLHKGIVRVGNFGSEDMFNYTVIGDGVNLTWRLESLTRYYGVRIIASESLLDSLPEDAFHMEIDRVRVKGKSLPTSIHTVLSRTDYLKRAEELDEAVKALAAYRAMDFVRAKGMFIELEKKTPQKLYLLYRSRCENMIVHPPGPDWDGIFKHVRK